MSTFQFIEIIAIITGLISVWHAKKESILVFPFGIITVSLSIYLFYKQSILANSAINFYYLLMNCYGWINWKRNNQKIQISNCSKKENIISAIIIIISFISIAYVRWLWSIYQDNLHFLTLDLILDALTSSLFICAMWLMANKKIEHWFLWIIGNTICIPFFFYQDLKGLSFLYLTYSIIAILGYKEWTLKKIK